MEGKKIAILMSIDYDGTSASVCDHDVDMMYRLLRETYGFHHIYKTSQLIKYETSLVTQCKCSGSHVARLNPPCGCTTTLIPATREAVESALSTAASSDFVLFYYSGHGYQSGLVTSATSGRRFTQPQAHLLDMNGAPLSGDTLLGFAEDCDASEQMYILDACFASNLMPMPFEMDGQYPQVHRAPGVKAPQSLSRKKITVLSAAAGATMMDDDGSDMTKSLVSVLQRNPRATVEELIVGTQHGIERTFGSNFTFTPQTPIIGVCPDAAGSHVVDAHASTTGGVIWSRRIYQERHRFVAVKKREYRGRDYRLARIYNMLRSLGGLRVPVSDVLHIVTYGLETYAAERQLTVDDDVSRLVKEIIHGKRETADPVEIDAAPHALAEEPERVTITAGGENIAH